MIKEWLERFFKPKTCGVCLGSLGRDYSVICYRVSDCTTLQEMKVCQSCMVTLELTHQEMRKTLDAGKTVIDA